VAKKGRGGAVGEKGKRWLASAAVLALVVCAASMAVGLRNRTTRPPIEEISGNVRLEVLNGTGEEGLGRVVARALMSKNIDVLFIGNADAFDYPASILIARRENAEIKTLGELIGCRHLIEQLKDDSMVDATLIIGADYRRLDLGSPAESGLSE